MLFAKKSLGQNFLTSTAARFHIVEAGGLAAGNTVVEIGPGKGFLTEALLEKLSSFGAGADSGRLIALEKDDRLIPFLQKKFAAQIASGKLEIIHRDVLEWNPEESGLSAGSYKLIANIPYYITGLLFRKFLETPIHPEKIVVMVQKEVAERIVARDGKESILSLSVKAYGSPRIVSIVKAGSFNPAPNVDSAILEIAAISKRYFSGISEERFFSVIKAAFAGKRKTLRNNLRGFFAGKKEGALEEILLSLGLPEDVRAEDIAPEKWTAICSAIS